MFRDLQDLIRLSVIIAACDDVEMLRADTNVSFVYTRHAIACATGGLNTGGSGL